MIKGFEDTFDYKSNSIKEYDLEPNLKVRIIRISDDVATIFFVDNTGETVPVPENTEFREITDKTSQKHRFNHFFLTWIATYGLFRNGVKVLTFSDKKQHLVSSDCILGYRNY
jgi:hypothetical protein